MNSTTTTMPDAATTNNPSLAASGKYLTFNLGSECYGVAVLKVREIIRLTTITSVAQAPSYVRGVINLRGKIIPVIDLRLRLGLAQASETEQSCIIVVQAQITSEKTALMGLVVDGVEEVLNLAAAEIEEAPEFGTQMSTDYIVGMAKIKGAVKTLLDIDRVLSDGSFGV
jgi:purine-binding chemotaxis protein CheW